MDKECGERCQEPLRAVNVDSQQDIYGPPPVVLTQSVRLLPPSDQQVTDAKHTAQQILAGNMPLPRPRTVPGRIIDTFENGTKAILERLDGHRNSTGPARAEPTQQTVDWMPKTATFDQLGTLANNIADTEARLATRRHRLNMTYKEVIASTKAVATAHNSALVVSVRTYTDLRDYLTTTPQSKLTRDAVLTTVQQETTGLAVALSLSSDEIAIEENRIVAQTAILRAPPGGEIVGGFEPVFAKALRDHGGAVIGDSHGNFDTLRWLQDEMPFFKESNVGFLGLEMFQAKDQNVLDQFQDRNSANYRNKKMLVDYLERNHWGERWPGWPNELANTADRAVESGIRLVALDTDKIEYRPEQRLAASNTVWESSYRQAKMVMPSKYGIIFGGQAHASHRPSDHTAGVDQELGIPAFNIFEPSRDQANNSGIRWDMRPGKLYFNPDQTQSVYEFFPPRHTAQP